MRIFSGIQPSGNLHIGNYLGMLKHAVALQEKNECFFSIVDLHALTEQPDPETLRLRLIETAINYLAAGIDSQRSVLFVQSEVPAHSEMMWLLATIASLGDLERMTQYKEKGRDAAKRGALNAGLLMYPVLMAADILLYRAQGVPVGEDQAQHLELVRRLARRFNERFTSFDSSQDKPLFPEPQTLLPKTTARVMSLLDPKKKMSKSHGPESFIGLFDEPEVIRRKLKRAVTDSGKTITFDPKRRPALANLLSIYASLADEEPKQIAKRFAGVGFEKFKQVLSEHLIEKLSPLREKRKVLAQSPAHVRAILDRGAERARIISAETLRDAQHKMGIR